MKRMFGVGIGIGVCVLGLSACGNVTGLYIADAATMRASDTAAAIKGKEAPQPINLDTYCFPEVDAKTCKEKPNARAYVKATQGDAATTVMATTTVSGATAATAARNRLMYIIMLNSERICTFHKAAIMSNSASANFTTDLLSGTLSAVSAVMNPVATKTGLSLASTVTSLGSSTYNAQFFMDTLAPAVTARIDELRAGKWEKIKAKEVDSTAKFSVDEMIMDLSLYHQKCSFYVGLQDLVKDKKPKIRDKQSIQAEIKKLEADVKAAKLEISPLAGKGSRTKFETDLLEVYQKRVRNALISIERLKIRQEYAPGEFVVEPSKKETAG